MLNTEWVRIMTAIGTSTKDLRCVLGWSQQELADRAITSQGAISRLESCRTTEMPLRTVVIVLRALAEGAQVMEIPLTPMARSLISFTQRLTEGLTPTIDPELVTMVKTYGRMSAPRRAALVQFVRVMAPLEEQED